MAEFKEKKYNYLYKTTLEGSNDYYVGKHSSDKDPTKDSYKGSGNWVRSIKNKKLLHRTELQFFNTAIELKKAEKLLIKENIGKHGCNNISHGTAGSPPGTNARIPKSEEHRKKLSDARTGKFCGEDNTFFGKTHTEESKKKMSNSAMGKIGSNHNRFGKNHTEESKKKISDARIGKYSGENNPRAILNNISVKEIKILLRDGHTCVYIAKLYNISQGAIYGIKYGRTWAHHS